jgi:hypothetical protein
VNLISIILIRKSLSDVAFVERDRDGRKERKILCVRGKEEMRTFVTRREVSSGERIPNKECSYGTKINEEKLPQKLRSSREEHLCFESVDVVRIANITVS